MKRSASAAVALMGMLFTLPVLAQDMPAETTDPSAEAAPAEAAPAEAAPEASAEAAPAEATPEAAAADAAPAEAAPADAAAAEAAPSDAVPADASAESAPVDAAAPADASAELAPADAGMEAAPVEEAAVAEAPVEESAPVEEAPAEEAASEDSGEPFQFYIAADKAELTLSLSDDDLETQFGGDEFESSMYRIRAGMRLLEAVGIELHYGISDDDGSEAGKFEVGQYYGIFVVPTGSLFDLVEISVPIGYSSTDAERGNASETFDGVSYGLNIEVPITLGSDWFPDLRIGGGGLVYRADQDSRMYGYHFGVRLDFKI